MNVRVFDSTDFTLSDTALTVVPMDTAEYDTGTPVFFDGTDLVIPVDGLYSIVGSLIINGSASFAGGASLAADGFEFAANYAHSRVSGETNELDVTVSATAHFTAGQVITLSAQMSAGTPGTVVSDSEDASVPQWSPTLAVSLLVAD